METMRISAFKARAIATLKRIKATGRPVVVTIRGEPVAEVVPPRAVRERAVILGSGRGLMAKRPADAALVEMSAGDEWEMNG